MKNIPKHVAIIMDGNGRWATRQGLSRSAGHKEGAKTLEKIALHAIDVGIEVLSVYAFSTDNFKRSKEEVDYLMNLLILYFNKKLNKVIDKGIKIVVSGRRENLSDEVLNAIDNVEKRTKDNKNGILNVCLNYGGQEEIIDASLKLHEDLNNGLIKREEINRESFYKYLYKDLPPIDLLIRTGKEHRLSNFMLYQLYYAEIYFSDLYFPDFKEKDLDYYIDDFNNRDRRFGGINEKKEVK